MGRSNKQKHGTESVDGKGRSGSSCAGDTVPRQLAGSIRHHAHLAAQDKTRLAHKKAEWARLRRAR